MELSKIALLLLLLFCNLAWGNEAGHILFLINQGDQCRGLELYQEEVKTTGSHDFELLHQIGLGILDDGFRKKDPEIQLLALFGASISGHEEAYYILEESIRSPFPPIQLAGVNAIARLENDRMDQLLIKAMSANHPLIRLEAAYQLCKKRHYQAISQTESLMFKFPKEVLPLFPQLFALVDDEQSTRLLRKLLTDSSEKVRVATILSIAQNKRDDFLPQIRTLAAQHHFSQQEACAYALGLLKDDKSVVRLQQLARSQYPHVALAASLALYRLGREESLFQLQQAAEKGNLFAIRMLGEVEGSEDFLCMLRDNGDLQIRINATLSLLDRRDIRCINGLREILVRDNRDLAMTEISSPGWSMMAWKAVSSGSQILKDDETAYAIHLQFKEDVLDQTRELKEDAFLKVAGWILAYRQYELVPQVVELLTDMKTKKSIALIKKYQQQVGSPLVRHYCNLALYQLKEEGPYGKYLKEWVKSQQDHALIRFLPMLPWDKREPEMTYCLTPEETTRLLVDTFAAFASQQDPEGLDILIETIKSGNSKNKYAFAGLLLRATQ